MKSTSIVNSTIRSLLEGSEPPQEVAPQPQQPQVDPNTLSTQEVAAVESQIRGIEDPVKTFIDRVIDMKNTALQQESNQEIGNLINKA